MQNAWQRRHRLGLIASLDNHRRQPGNTHCGLAAVLAREQAREALHAASKARRCYATTRARTLLHLQVDDVFMGDVSPGKLRSRAVKVEARVAGTVSLERVDIVVDNRMVYTPSPDGPLAVFTWGDLWPFPAPETLCFVGATQVDGEMAWPSPVWIER